MRLCFKCNIQSLCREYQVTSYPTILFMGKTPQQESVREKYDGDHHWEEVKLWYEDLMNPSVEKLDERLVCIRLDFVS